MNVWGIEYTHTYYIYIWDIDHRIIEPPVVILGLYENDVCPPILAISLEKIMINHRI